ncbi:MAG: helix-turn-helix domain-containing protein [Rhodobacteraceae bacterium]|nr:helix-turn-helix domain-containing protein [Paracoccaceae bacterium]
MDKNHALAAFGALSQRTRLDVFRLLIKAGVAGMSAGEISETLGVRQNTMSANLSVLVRSGLIRNAREGRSIRYFADMGGLRGLLAFLMEECCGGRPETCQPVIDELACADQETAKTRDPYNVLFLCTGNSARSIIAEAIMNREGKGKFRAFSAGSKPGSGPHPYTLDLLEGLNYDTGFARSKSWDEFSGPDEPQMDFVFTVCDSAAAEECPFWPGQPITAHWGLPDPVAVEGPEAVRRAAFLETYRTLRSSITNFISLPMSTTDGMAFQRKLDDIAKGTARSATSPIHEGPA